MDAELGPEGGDYPPDDEVLSAASDLGEYQEAVNAASAQVSQAERQAQESQDYLLAHAISLISEDELDDDNDETFGGEAKEHKKKKKRRQQVGMPKSAAKRKKEKERLLAAKRKADEEEAEVPITQAAPVIHLPKLEGSGVPTLSALAKMAAFRGGEANGLGAMPMHPVKASRWRTEAPKWEHAAFAPGQRVIVVSGATAIFDNFRIRDQGQNEHAAYDHTELMKCQSIKRGTIEEFVRAGENWEEHFHPTSRPLTKFEIDSVVDEPNYFLYEVKYDDANFELVHGYYISFEKPGEMSQLHELSYTWDAVQMCDERHKIEKRYKQVNSYMGDGYWHPDYGSKATGPCYRRRME